MEISEVDALYSDFYSVENPLTDSRRLIIYGFPSTLNENGIYNILEHIKCPPTNIVLMNTNSMKNGEEKYFASTKTSMLAIVEFLSKENVDKAFYIISSQYKDRFHVQYAYRSKHSGQISCNAKRETADDLLEVEKLPQIDQELQTEVLMVHNNGASYCNEPSLPDRKSNDIELPNSTFTNGQPNGLMKFNTSSFVNKFCTTVGVNLSEEQTN